MSRSSLHLALVALLVILLGCSRSGGNLEIAGLTCGTSVDQIKRLHPNDQLRPYRLPDGAEVVTTRLVVPPYELVDVSADPQRGVHGMLALYKAVPGDQWATLRKDLVSRFGEPSSARKAIEPDSNGELMIWGSCTSDLTLIPRLQGSGCCLSAFGLVSRDASGNYRTGVTLTLRDIRK